MGARDSCGAGRMRAMRRGRSLVLLALLALAAAGCSLLDYAPWPSSGGGGRPAPPRRYRVQPPPSSQPSEQPSAPAGEESQEVRQGQTAYSPLRGTDALRLAQRLSPASQSLSSFADLDGPLRQSLAHLSRQPQGGAAFTQEGGRLTWGQLRASAEELLGLLPALDANPGLLAERFVWYELAPEPLVTGYYTPEVPASLTRQPGFETPLYARPPDLRQATPDELRQGRPRAYRLENGAIQPYHDRRAIDQDGVLAGRGLELAWVKGPLDAFILQTEGAGVLLLPDGSRRAVQFAAGNGHEFKGLGQLLLASGALTRERLGRESVREWCEANPERARELMAGNRSYVFFELRQGENAGASLGALEKPLTPLVSLATDPSLLPLGAVAALDLSLPGAAGGPATTLRGLVLAQDTGADIRGARLDLFLGGGERAQRLEAGLRTHAGLHLLVSKNALRAASVRGQ